MRRVISALFFFTAAGVLSAGPLPFSFWKTASVAAAGWDDVTTLTDGGHQYPGPNTAYGNPVTLRAGSATKARIHIAEYGGACVVVASLHNSAGTLLASGSATPSDVGYLEITFGTPATVTAGAYILAFQVQNNNLGFSRELGSTGGHEMQTGVTYPTPPNPYTIQTGVDKLLATSGVYVQ